MSNLFGGTKKVSLLTPGQHNLLEGVTGILQNQLGKSGPVYEGPITPGVNATQQGAFDYAGNLLNNLGQTDQAIASMLRGESANAVDPQAYYRDAVLNPAKQAFEDAQRQIEARYGGSFGQTGAFQDIMAENAARFGTGIGSIMAELALSNQDRSNAQRALGVQSSFGNQANTMNTLNAMLGVGGEQRSIEAQQNSDAYNRWAAAQEYNNPWLGLLGPALGTQAFALGQDRGIMGNINQGIGTLSGLKGLLGGS